jgi:hypothetical protein
MSAALLRIRCLSPPSVVTIAISDNFRQHTELEWCSVLAHGGEHGMHVSLPRNYGEIHHLLLAYE